MKCPCCAAEIVFSVHKAPPTQAAPSGDVGELLKSIDCEALDAATRKFFDDTVDRVAKYGARAMISPKQSAWLERLAKEHPRSGGDDESGIPF